MDSARARRRLNTLLIFGFGYCGHAVANAAPEFNVVSTTRSDIVPDAERVRFDAAEAAIAAASHILVTVGPGVDGDPVLRRYAGAIAASPARWIGYLSSTVVYGDRGGDWVDEDTRPMPSQPRGQLRLDAELAWSRFAGQCEIGRDEPGHDVPKGI